SAGTTVISVPLSVIAAQVMNRRSRFATLIGVALLLPWAIAPVVTGFYWRFMFQPTFGVFTIIANTLGLAHGDVTWLQDGNVAIFLAMVALAWRTVPLLGILTLAALKTIPEAHYRAARMDGAGPWQTFRFITLPAIRGTLLITTVLTIIVSLQTFDIFFQLTQGGPGFSTTTITYYIFESAIQNLSLGYSAALALLLLFIIVVFSSLAVLLRGRSPRERPDQEDLTTAVRPVFRRLIDGSAGQGGRAFRLSTTRYDGDGFGDRPRRRRLRIPDRATRIMFGLGAAAFLVWSLFPTLWILLASTQPEGAVTGPQLALTLPTLDHYASLLRDPAWVGSIAVSLEVAIGATAIALILGALAAYPLARLEVPGKRLFLGLMIFTQMVPEIVLAIPVLLIFRTLGLLDTVAALIIVNTAFLLPLVIWLLRNVFLAVPKALESSARIDGATRLGTLFRVTMPAASAGISATVILLLISIWNEFMFAVILGNTAAVTVTRRIGFINSPTTIGAAQPPYTLQAAAGILAVLPCVILLFLFHRRITAGLTEGYVKG
ncbi:MAG TPA: ABC transporter permease subunit, partial [Candidatus Saccharimonadales bacterium]|nr:ABC transporter permease subunit [Candidatus Saccharimonadales bacterium]